LNLRERKIWCTKILHNEELRNWYCLPNNIKVIKLGVKRHLDKSSCRWKENIKIVKKKKKVVP